MNGLRQVSRCSFGVVLGVGMSLSASFFSQQVHGSNETHHQSDNESHREDVPAAPQPTIHFQKNLRADIYDVVTADGAPQKSYIQFKTSGLYQLDSDLVVLGARGTLVKWDSRQQVLHILKGQIYLSASPRAVTTRDVTLNGFAESVYFDVSEVATRITNLGAAQLFGQSRHNSNDFNVEVGQSQLIQRANSKGQVYVRLPEPVDPRKLIADLWNMGLRERASLAAALAGWIGTYDQQVRDIARANKQLIEHAQQEHQEHLAMLRRQKMAREAVDQSLVELLKQKNYL